MVGRRIRSAGPRGRSRAVGYYYRRRDVTIALRDAGFHSLSEARLRAAFVHEVLEQGGTVREAKDALRVIEAKKLMHADVIIASLEASEIMLKDQGGGSECTWT